MFAGQTSRIILISGLSLAIGLLLVVTLGPALGFDFSRLPEDLMGLNPVFVLLILASTLLHFLVSAAKWRMVTEAIAPETKSSGGYYTFSALNGLISNFIPLQFSTVAVRSLMMKFRDRMPLLKGAASTVYDLMFDLTVTTLAVIAAIPAIFGVLSPAAAFAFFLVELVIGGTVISLFNRRAAVLFVGIGRRIPLLRNFIRRSNIAAELSGNRYVPLFSVSLTARLFFLSALRYLNLLIRNYLVVPAAALSIGFLPVAMAMPLIQFATIVSVTPANLGVSEWGWVGLLAVFGVAAKLSARFALIKRLVFFLAILLINVVSLPIVIIASRRRSSISEMETSG
jgi:uncharacterized protein (TIRG00374 family)